MIQDLLSEVTPLTAIDHLSQVGYPDNVVCELHLLRS